MKPHTQRERMNRNLLAEEVARDERTKPVEEANAGEATTALCGCILARGVMTNKISTIRNRAVD